MSVFLIKLFLKNQSRILIGKIAKYPERYIGLFRPTKPKAKIIQNLLQSHEIRFGDAFERLIEEYVREFGFSILNKRFTDNTGRVLEVDQMFMSGDDVFFIEQKIRDDHDSTKKRGQIDNFEKKIEVISGQYGASNCTGFFYFIDDSFSKNRNFYEEKIGELSDDYGVRLYLLYGNELFQQIGRGEIWNEVTNYLEMWKANIPDLPEINFDMNPDLSFNEIKNLETIIYRKLFSNPDLAELLHVLFPERLTLNLLAEFFIEKHQSGQGKIYETLNELCKNIMREMENRES